MNESTAHMVTLWCAILAKLQKGAARQLAGASLTMLQYRVLLQVTLADAGETGVSRLSRMLVARPSSVETAVEALCERGLLREDPQPQPAAGGPEPGPDPTSPPEQAPCSLLITDAGMLAVAEGSARFEAFFALIRSQLTDDEIRLCAELFYESLACPGGPLSYAAPAPRHEQRVPLPHLLTVMEMFPQMVSAVAKKTAALSFTDFRFLLELYPKRRGVVKRLRAKDMAALLRVKRAYITTAAYRLEEAGLVVRDPDPADARGLLLGITSAGAGVVNSAGDDVAAAVEGLFAIRRRNPAHLRSLTKHLLAASDIALEQL